MLIWSRTINKKDQALDLRVDRRYQCAHKKQFDSFRRCRGGLSGLSVSLDQLLWSILGQHRTKLPIVALKEDDRLSLVCRDAAMHHGQTRPCSTTCCTSRKFNVLSLCDPCYMHQCSWDCEESTRTRHSWLHAEIVTHATWLTGTPAAASPCLQACQLCTVEIILPLPFAMVVLARSRSVCACLTPLFSLRYSESGLRG